MFQARNPKITLFVICAIDRNLLCDRAHLGQRVTRAAELHYCTEVGFPDLCTDYDPDIQHSFPLIPSLSGLSDKS